jgi:hypothetical protein
VYDPPDFLVGPAILARPAQCFRNVLIRLTDSRDSDNAALPASLPRKDFFPTSASVPFSCSIS